MFTWMAIPWPESLLHQQNMLQLRYDTPIEMQASYPMSDTIKANYEKNVEYIDK
jgi:hypothetical protein